MRSLQNTPILLEFPIEEKERKKHTIQNAELTGKKKTCKQTNNPPNVALSC